MEANPLARAAQGFIERLVVGNQPVALLVREVLLVIEDQLSESVITRKSVRIGSIRAICVVSDSR